MVTVLTVGTFDIPHMGHATFLQKCSEHGEVVVGVLSDRFVTTVKNPPVYSEQERAAAVARLGYETLIVDGTRSGQHPLTGPMLERFDYVAVGLDWFGDKYLARLGMTVDELQTAQVGLLFVPYTDTISTSDIKRRLRGST